MVNTISVFENQKWKISNPILSDKVIKNTPAIKSTPKKSSGINSTLLVSEIITAISLVLFAYLMFYTAPEQNVELVKVIAVTEQGCIAETLDGYSVSIGNCQAQLGQYVNALVDQKVKERTALMNPTN